MQPSENKPQISVVSVFEDDERIRPLVLGLRERGIDAWWNGEADPATRWGETVGILTQNIPITGLVISAAGLRSSDLRSVLDVPAPDSAVAIRVDPNLYPGPLPQVRVSQTIDFLRETDLRDTLDSLERIIRNTESSQGQAKSQPSITLYFDDATSSETWLVSPDLKWVVEATDLIPPTDPKFPVSFAALLRTLLWNSGSWHDWIADTISSSGFDIKKVPPVSDRELTTSPLRATTSAASLLRSARSFAERSGTVPDIQHLIAAFIYEPAGHEKDLENYNFDRVYWANALIDEVSKRSPDEVALFTELRDKVFPVSPNPPIAQEQNQPKPPDIWQLANDDLKEALAWAAAMASPGEIDTRALLGGLVRTQAFDRSFWKLIESVAPDLVGPEDQPCSRVLEKVGLPSPSAPETLAGLPILTHEADALVARGLMLSSGWLEGADLQAAATFLGFFEPNNRGEPAPIDGLLPALGLNAESFLQAVIQDANGTGAVADYAREVLALRTQVQPWDRPHVDNDRVEGAIPPDRDLLDARRPAERFAKLLTAKDVQPPIALGLFGNWGSGKTFFMGLVRNRINELSAGGGDYVERVVQIEFNAWHYHDTNLWASLAMRIFEGIALELADNKESDIEAKRKELHQKLRSSEARQKEANDRRDQALQRRSTKAQELEQKRAELAQLEKKNHRRRLEAAWETLTQDAVFADFRKTVDKLGKHFGITAAIQSAEDLKKLRQDIDETSGRALGLFNAVGQRFHGVQNIAITIGLLTLAVGVALSLGFVSQGIARRMEIVLPDFSNTIVEIATLVSAIAAWCGRRVREVRGAIDHVAKVEAALVAHEKKLPPIDPKLQTEIAELDKTIHQASEELAAAEREIAEATVEIDRINRGGLVYDFLEERRTSANYVGHLGLISTIRQDLDRLGALLKDFAEKGQNPIGRIILYIDDLDRCHPDKVVEVLQAVHLLLAFDLFNVIVGVDARWLERSLRKQYVGTGTQTKGEDPFSPQDYLEKIFQIPYSLSRIDETGFQKLIAGMVKTRTDQAKEKQQKQTPAEVQTKTVAASEPQTIALPQQPQTETPAEEIKQSVEPITNTAAAKAMDAKPSTMAQALYFEDHEETFIQLLYEFIDRPRLAKRFVNIYRLLRVRADDEGESIHFAGTPASPQYRAALVLLAIYVGHPTVAAKIVRALDYAGSNRTWQPMLEALASGALKGVVMTPRERAEIATIVEKLQKMGPRVADDLAAYRIWAPRVACFSFDWHRPDTLPTAQPHAEKSKTAKA